MFTASNGYTFEYNISPFIKSYKTNNLLTLDNGNSISGTKDSSLRKSMLGTIGEGFERQLLFSTSVNDLKDDENKLTCINLFKKELEKKTLDSHTIKYFTDTCGLATHTNSDSCLENSFCEFVERQSFIFSYLSKKKASVVKKNNLFKEIIPKKYHGLDFFEISLVESFRVFFAIGKITDDSICIGLGAGYTSEDALRKLLKEIISPNKHGDITLKKNEHIDYIHIFNLLSLDQIIEAYSYLKKSNVQFLPVKEEKNNMDIVLEELNRKWGIQPLCLSLISINKDKVRYRYAKNFKVFDTNWFPSLSLLTYDEKIYSNIEKRTGYMLSREINFIPFP